MPTPAPIEVALKPLIRNAPRPQPQMAESKPQTSRIPGFYKMELRERLRELRERGVIDDGDEHYLLSREGGLPFDAANNMVENAIGVLELPLGLGLNFVVNDREYIVPMAVEEPSVIAAVSHIGKIVRDAGGFFAACPSSEMIGQIQVLECPDLDAAEAAITAAQRELVDAANALDQPLVASGGGATAIELRRLEGPGHEPMLIVHLIVDCCDAMGANAINTMAEGIAPRIEELSGGKVFLRILSNLADRRVATATCRIPFERLAWRGYTGEQVARGVEAASQFALADPYRAATHNKGIMNGVSAVCIATGNDWRAIEAGAHAFACRNGKYGPLATWWVEEGALCGQIEIPAAVGVIGGTLKIHPTVQLMHKVLGVDSAAELGEVMAAVGLAQNLAALKALATEGIQRGHMSLHARSVAATAGATDAELDEVVRQMLGTDDVRLESAKRILAALRTR